MKQLKAILNSSQFAQAAYAVLNNSLNGNDGYTDALELKDNFSEAQATQFASQYSIIHDQQNTTNGFSATLFKDSSDQYTLAIRGTEVTDYGVDLILTDIADIGADGIALKQGVDLFNYYQKLMSPAGVGNAMQLKIVEGIIPPPAGTPNKIIDQGGGPLSAPVYRYLKVIAPANGLGVIPAGSKINVTGHSLGGHLALIMARLDPNHINQVYTYNAPGFDTGIIGSDDTEWFFNAVGYAQTQTEGSTTVASGFPTAKLHNLAIELDVISDIGTIPGEQVFQFGEASGRVEAHRIGGMTDALAVSNLIDSLSVNTNLSLSEIGTYLNTASNQADESLEKPSISSVTY